MRVRIFKALNKRSNNRRAVLLKRNGSRSRFGFMLRAKSASLLGMRKPGIYTIDVREA